MGYLRPKLNQLAKQWMDSGKEEDRLALINSCLPLCHHIVKRFKPADENEYEDLLSAAYIGLLRAVGNCNSEKGKSRLAFSTCAYADTFSSVKDCVSLRLGHGHLATGRDVGGYRRFLRLRALPDNKENRAAFSKQRKLTSTASKNMSVHLDVDITAPEDITRLAGEDKSMRMVDVRDCLDTMMTCLTDREATVLKRIYLYGDGLAEIGRDIGVSRARVLQLKNGAIERVRRCWGVSLDS